MNEYTTSKFLAPWSSLLTEMVQDANSSVSIIENFIMIPDISEFEYRKDLKVEWIMETEVLLWKTMVFTYPFISVLAAE